MWVLRVVLPDEPQPASAAAINTTKAIPRTVGLRRPVTISLIDLPPAFPVPRQPGPPARGANRPQLAVPAARVPPPRRSRSSGGRLAAVRRHPARPRTLSPARRTRRFG